MDVVLTPSMSLLLAVVVLFVGRFLNQKIAFLNRYNIPEPVAGGLLLAIVFFVLHTMFGYTLAVYKPLQDSFMLMFFASIGLTANFAKLKAGGKPLLIFLLIISVFVLLQNAVGMSVAALLGLDELMGVMAGSIALIGGLGTAGAWGPIFESQYAVQGALTMGIASATFGMIIGGLMGGPLARHLIEKHQLKQLISSRPQQHAASQHSTDQATSKQDMPLHLNSEQSNAEPTTATLPVMTVDNAVLTVGMFAFALVFAEVLSGWTQGTAWQMPTFVWALLGGIVLRNVLELVLKQPIFEHAIDVFGNTALALYLAMALVSLKLWQLADLAIPMLIILIAQTITMWLFAVYVSFRVMGKDYDSAVLAAGLCGFAMGATPNAIANMQAITNRYGASYKAFLIVPLVGAFFIDLVNVVVIQGILQMFG